MKLSFILFTFIYAANAFTLEAPKTHFLNLRLISHGQNFDLTQMVNKAEAIYSQCENLNLKIHIVDHKIKEETRLHEDMRRLESIPYVLTQNYFDFFSPYMDQDPHFAIDVHLVEYLSSSNRKNLEREQPLAALIQYGVAYPHFLSDWLYRAREYYPSSYAPSEVSRNSVFIATATLKFSLREMTSLLAHEIGHILADPQRPTLNELYIDHYCSHVKGPCPAGNLMQAGANHPNPTLSAEQCQTIVQHPLIKSMPLEETL